MASTQNARRLTEEVEGTEAVFGRSRTPEAADARRVFIHHFGGELAVLVKAVESLGYEPVTGDPEVESDGCIGALIGVRDHSDLTLANSLAVNRSVLLYSDDKSFRFRLAAARAGALAVLWSPLDMVELSGWLEECERENASISVLIVDDDEVAGETYSLALQQAGMQTHIVAQPEQVPDAVETLSPDLILLDLNMPGADGLEVARVVRQSRRALSLPIVFLSAERDRGRQNLARSIGGDDFITKPVNLDDLAAQVRMRAERALALKQVMERDSLTGLLNHGRFKDRILAEVDRSGRTGAPISVCLIDIDHFKEVNDRFGHPMGDQVIRTLAHLLVGGLRKTDVVARYGGEEFGILLLDTSGPDALPVIEKLRRRFAEFTFGSGASSFAVTFSAGICEGWRECSADRLIGTADEALYVAKNNGRNRVVLG